MLACILVGVRLCVLRARMYLCACDLCTRCIVRACMCVCDHDTYYHAQHVSKVKYRCLSCL